MKNKLLQTVLVGCIVAAVVCVFIYTSAQDMADGSVPTTLPILIMSEDNSRTFDVCTIFENQPYIAEHVETTYHLGLTSRFYKNGEELLIENWRTIVPTYYSDLVRYADAYVFDTRNGQWLGPTSFPSNPPSSSDDDSVGWYWWWGPVV